MSRPLLNSEATKVVTNDAIQLAVGGEESLFTVEAISPYCFGEVPDGVS